MFEQSIYIVKCDLMMMILVVKQQEYACWITIHGKLQEKVSLWAISVYFRNIFLQRRSGRCNANENWYVKQSPNDSLLELLLHFYFPLVGHCETRSKVNNLKIF